MRTGACCIALGSLCFLLTACGGGSPSGSTIPNAAGIPSSSTSGNNPSPGPSPSPYPLTDGNALVYAGQLTQTFQSFPEVVPPGSPSPEPTSATTVNVTQNVTVKSNQSFNGAGGLYDLHSAETDAYASGLKTTTSTTDTYETIAQNGAANSQMLDYGSKFVDEAGDSTTTSYAPAAILDQLPETPGAQWSNGAAASIQEAVAGDANGSPITVQRTISADGSYNEATTYPPNYSFVGGYVGVGQIQERADGSGSYAFVADNHATTILYSLPVPQLSGPPLITVAVYNGLDPTPVIAPAAAFHLPAWYGSAPALYGESDRDLGLQPVPTSCNLSSQFPQSATELLQTINRTDTVLGYTEQETTANYVANGYGTVCTVLQDKQSLIYDFNGDQPFVFTKTPPLEIITLSETLSLQPGSNITGAPSAQAIRSLRTSSFGVSRALRVSFDRAVSALRRQHVAALVRASQRLRARGGAQ